jgi:hypothetical protein
VRRPARPKSHADRTAREPWARRPTAAVRREGAVGDRRGHVRRPGMAQLLHVEVTGGPARGDFAARTPRPREEPMSHTDADATARARRHDDAGPDLPAPTPRTEQSRERPARRRMDPGRTKGDELPRLGAAGRRRASSPGATPGSAGRSRSPSPARAPTWRSLTAREEPDAVRGRSADRGGGADRGCAAGTSGRGLLGRLVADAVAGLGGLDILSTTPRPSGPHVDPRRPTEELDSILKTNIYAMYWITKAAMARYSRPGATINNTAGSGGGVGELGGVFGRVGG